MVTSQCPHSRRHVMSTCSIPVVLTLVIWLKLYLTPTMELRSFLIIVNNLWGMCLWLDIIILNIAVIVWIWNVSNKLTYSGLGHQLGAFLDGAGNFRTCGLARGRDSEWLSSLVSCLWPLPVFSSTFWLPWGKKFQSTTYLLPWCSVLPQTLNNKAR